MSEALRAELAAWVRAVRDKRKYRKLSVDDFLDEVVEPSLERAVDKGEFPRAYRWEAREVAEKTLEDLGGGG